MKQWNRKHSEWCKSRKVAFSVMLISAIGLPVISCTKQGPGETAHDPIRPYYENSFYWEYNNKPILLLGGSQEDNLFNHPDLNPDGLEGHLDILIENGGNYLRNTMSSRNPGNRYPFRQLDNGLFDLDDWDEEYWSRFEEFLEMTYERDIIVQLEFWDPWDMYMSEGEGMTDFRDGNTGWESHPFNPGNNMNYDSEESGLLTIIDFFPSAEPTSHTLFHTVPEMDNNRVVLPYQQRFIDKVLSYTLQYPHLLYCMNNETGEDVKWGDYWIQYIREKAEEAGVDIYTTDMRRNEEINGTDHRYIHDRPEIYTFVEISQNNGQSITGQRHYDAIIELRSYLMDRPRPMNNNKIYGGADGWGGPEEGQQKFWRNIFAGSASARFHRPPAGLGLNDLAISHIKSMRMVMEEINLFHSNPANQLLSGKEDNEAFLLAKPGTSYAAYFPQGGSVHLDLSDVEGEFRLRWLDIVQNEWREEEAISGGNTIPLETPAGGHHVALILLK